MAPHRRARPLRFACAGLLLQAGCLRQMVVARIERTAFVTPPGGVVTPDALGAPSERWGPRWQLDVAGHHARPDVLELTRRGRAGLAGTSAEDAG